MALHHFPSLFLLLLLLLFSVALANASQQVCQEPQQNQQKVCEEPQQQKQVCEEVRSDNVNDGGSCEVKVDFDELKSKVQLLETRLEESNANLKRKDEKILELETVIQEKSQAVASLQSEIETAQRKGTSDAEELVGKAQVRASELQKQVEELKKVIEQQSKGKEALESQARLSENKIKELSLKLDKLQKINEEQKSRIRKTERALHVAEDEMMKAKLEATSKSKELMEVHDSWLPPWLLDHLLRTWSFVEVEWNEHGKPVMEVLAQKTLEKKSQAEKWAQPHVETIKTKYIPAVKEQWVVVTEYVEPQIKMLTAKSAEAYKASKSAVKPHIIKVQELADPCYQEVKKYSKPYIDQVATVAKPHVEKARTVLKPYTKKAVHACGRFLESATTYHNQVQDTVHEKLKQHEVTRPLATKELVWFLASALLALPVIILARICSAMFCKKSTKPSRSSHAHHGRRKGKRGYSDK